MCWGVDALKRSHTESLVDGRRGVIEDDGRGQRMLVVDRR